MPSSFPPPAAAADSLQALRQATQARHQRLDHGLALARPGASLDIYLRHVRVMRDWLAALAPLPAEAGWGMDGLAAACRDLDEPLPLGLSAALPVAAATGQAWGAAYVVEGSQLGGRVLLLRLRQAGLGHPMHFLQGRGGATGAHWSRFLQGLRQALATPQAVQAACDGACQAFDSLLARMQAAGLVAEEAGP